MFRMMTELVLNILASSNAVLMRLLEFVSESRNFLQTFMCLIRYII